MFLARVIGSVVSTRKSEKLVGAKLLVVDPVDFVHQKGEGKPLVAVDSVGAGEGEIVLVVQGSSARLTEASKDTPTDATIMAIVDSVEFDGRRTFTK
ncbi:MAG: EutN/CcmL family microcompartment protein [Deltaproteobacteria bacterium]|nr:EutN/CcmL family microcompartment protein [Deltaproteobacteria bacterium]